MTSVADASGKRESGLLDGNGFYEGRAPQCLRANERLSDDDVVMTPHYCSAYWMTGYVGGLYAQQIESFLNVTVNRTDWVKTSFKTTFHLFVSLQ